jgi:hypothetical protein
MELLKSVNCKVAQEKAFKLGYSWKFTKDEFEVRNLEKK